MTSTNLNIGFNDNKNSSRVLKPPGGGHTDIFGIRGDQPDVKTPNRRKNEPKTTLGPSFFMQEDNVSKNRNPIPTTEEKNGEEENFKNDNIKMKETDENKAPSKENDNQNNEKSETDNNQVPAPRRSRVPPGGYSSGLW